MLLLFVCDQRKLLPIRLLLLLLFCFAASDSECVCLSLCLISQNGVNITSACYCCLLPIRKQLLNRRSHSSATPQSLAFGPLTQSYQSCRSETSSCDPLSHTQGLAARTLRHQIAVWLLSFCGFCSSSIGSHVERQRAEGAGGWSGASLQLSLGPQPRPLLQ